MPNLTSVRTSATDKTTDKTVSIKFDKINATVRGAVLQTGGRSGAAGFIKAAVISNSLVEAGYKKNADGIETSEIRYGIQFRSSDEPWKSGKVTVITEDGEAKEYFASSYKNGEYSGIRLDEIPPIPEGELVLDTVEETVTF